MRAATGETEVVIGNGTAFRWTVVVSLVALAAIGGGAHVRLQTVEKDQAESKEEVEKLKTSAHGDDKRLQRVEDGVNDLKKSMEKLDDKLDRALSR